MNFLLVLNFLTPGPEWDVADGKADEFCDPADNLPVVLVDDVVAAQCEVPGGIVRIVCAQMMWMAAGNRNHRTEAGENIIFPKSQLENSGY